VDAFFGHSLLPDGRGSGSYTAPCSPWLRGDFLTERLFSKMFSHRLGSCRDRFERFVREFSRFLGCRESSQATEGKVREKCDDENPIFPGFFSKHLTLDPRGIDFRFLCLFLVGGPWSVACQRQTPD
jgi:hypothetical protein